MDDVTTKVERERIVGFQRVAAGDTLVEVLAKVGAPDVWYRERVGWPGSLLGLIIEPTWTSLSLIYKFPTATPDAEHRGQYPLRVDLEFSLKEKKLLRLDSPYKEIKSIQP